MKVNKDMYKPLDKFEKDLQNAFDDVDSAERPKNYKELLAYAVIAANNTSSKTKTVNIRIAEKDLIKLKAKGEEIGIPYHTILNSLVHQYVKGEIKTKI